MDTGFVTLHRKITENPIWEDSVLVHLFIHLLLMANHERKRILRKGQEMWIERGQLKTGQYLLAMQTGIPRGSIWRKLQTLENLGILSIESSNDYSIITIMKYDDYQSKEKRLSSKVSNKRVTDELRVSTNNNDNNYNNTNLTVSMGGPKVEIIEYLKEQQGLKGLDGTDKWNRIYAQHLLNKFKGDIERVKRFIDFALKDPYHRTKATSMKYLYSNLNRIALEAKAPRNQIAQL